jgi:lysyl-tRNA synthetase class 1
VLSAPPKNLNRSLSSELRARYQQLHSALNPQEWTEKAITEATKGITQTLDKQTQKDFFRYLYQAFFGRDQGPRISAFFAFTDPPLVLERLQYLASKPK